MRVFLGAYRAGSLAAAGRALGVDATTISRRLRALETATRTHLFQRTLDGLVPTSTAAGLFEGAERMERQAGLLDLRFAGDDARLEGSVRLALSDTFAAFFVRHVAALTTRYPRIELELVISDRLVDLAHGEADLAVRFSPPGKGIPGVGGDGGSVLAQKIGNADIGVFCSKAYAKRHGTPKRAADVAGHALVVPRASAPLLPGSDWSRAAEGTGRVALRADTLPTLIAAIAAGVGVGAIPAFAARAHDLVHIAPPAAITTRDVWLLVASDLRHVARVAAVRDGVAEIVARNASALTLARRAHR